MAVLIPSLGTKQLIQNLHRKSPLLKPKQLVTNIGDKAIWFIYKKRGSHDIDQQTTENGAEEQEMVKFVAVGDFGGPEMHAGHQNFAGVIFYDSYLWKSAFPSHHQGHLQQGQVPC
ncbi:hypothetical protein QQP08_006666 [Theobroma cacao]|uniref:Uncharacterized protein n=1 Tax=Theobroma cacao TaxID=3641 RepID=A0A061EC38_THECC|nr:Uncharacterized protein TCM_011879 [Theobroma cacao]WRX14179.1 hypothetical protein QQP08_006666 [Theobroma cacao]